MRNVVFVSKFQANLYSNSYPAQLYDPVGVSGDRYLVQLPRFGRPMPHRLPEMSSQYQPDGEACKNSEPVQLNVEFFSALYSKLN